MRRLLPLLAIAAVAVVPPVASAKTSKTFLPAERARTVTIAALTDDSDIAYFEVGGCRRGSATRVRCETLERYFDADGSVWPWESVGESIVRVRRGRLMVTFSGYEDRPVWFPLRDPSRPAERT